MFERHRLLWLYLRERTRLFSAPHRLLDIAPTWSLQRQLRMLPHVHYVSADLSSPMAGVRTDVTQLAFADAAFDAVLCYSVMETVPSDRTAMREIRRVLAPGGWALIHSYVDWGRDGTFEEPEVVSPEDRERVYGGRFNCRIYGRDYLERLRESGFAVELVDLASTMSPDSVQRLGLGNVRGVIVCRHAHDD